jgi:phospho-N-acetylmuramoyl-pentapeptide-transferase
MAFSIALALVSFALALGFGSPWVRFVRDRQFGKQINPSEPEENKSKEGTPTMGGAIIVAPVVAVTLAFGVLFTGRLILLLPLAVTVACAALGALDDSTTLLGAERSAGLSPRVKWASQAVICLAAASFLTWNGMTQIHVPLAGNFVLPGWAYLPFAAFVLIATMNAVAITDGLDSLLGTTGAIAFTAFWIVGTALGYPLTAALCATVVGALLGYLWFNAFPAQIFMGEIGALPLGGLLGTVALLEREPVILLPVGIIFVANAASDILQVLSNKLTSKRMFRTAPIHHHFRRPPDASRWVRWPSQAWPETWVVQRFWIVGALGALVGVAAAVRG